MRTILMPADLKTAPNEAVKSDPRSREQEPDVSKPLTEGEVASLLHCPVPGRVHGDAAQVHPAGTVPGEHRVPRT